MLTRTRGPQEIRAEVDKLEDLTQEAEKRCHVATARSTELQVTIEKRSNEFQVVMGPTHLQSYILGFALMSTTYLLTLLMSMRKAI